jgi:ferrous iron transport protein A
MPLTFCKTGEFGYVKHLSGKSETKRYLESLGFVVGSKVTVLSSDSMGVIVSVKNSRIAISGEMANKILI